jgi:hypothetical protein
VTPAAQPAAAAGTPPALRPAAIRSRARSARLLTRLAEGTGGTRAPAPTPLDGVALAGAPLHAADPAATAATAVDAALGAADRALRRPTAFRPGAAPGDPEDALVGPGVTAAAADPEAASGLDGERRILLSVLLAVLLLGGVTAYGVSTPGRR